MKQFNVLHLRTSQGVYGAEKVILGLAKGCENTRHTIGCLTKKGKYGHSFLDEIRRLGLHGEEIQSTYNIWDFRAVRQIVKILNDRRIEILHTHDFISDILGFLASRIYRVPLIKTEHGKTYNRNLWINICKKIDDWVVAEFFDYIVYVSENTKQNETNRYNIKKFTTIHNGIDVDAFSSSIFNSNPRNTELKRELGIPLEAKVIGSIGRLSSEKGYDYLLKAVQIIFSRFNKRALLLLIGDGNEKEQLKMLTDSLNISSNVIFAGYREDISGIMSIIDIYVNSSISENFPISVLEALSAARPVVATNVGDVSAMIKNGLTGLLIPAGNVEGLVNSILMLLEDEVLAKQFGEAGLKWVRANFSETAMAVKYGDIYKLVMEKRV